MEKILIVIAGMLATGKTTYGNQISKELGIPIFSKDKFKEAIYDSINQDKLEYEQKRKIGVTSYSVLYTVCEEMMKVGSMFIIESNFTSNSSIQIHKLIEKYNYKCIVIRFDADLTILHKRFLERERTVERHPGLVTEGVFDDFEKFKEVSNKAREFKINDEEILIDTSDFSKVKFEKIIEVVREKINESK